MARPPNLAVLITHCGQLILIKISKFDAAGCEILRLKCTKFDFRWGSLPQTRWGSLLLGEEVGKRKGKEGNRRERSEGTRREGRGGAKPPNILA